MTYQSLYRKYRPTQFEDVIGQETIVKSLENSIIKNKISHAYLFTGPRGTGKTTMAKLMAKSINCTDEGKVICGQCESCKQADAGSHPDIVEIDAASNNGVEEIRTLIERVKFTPIIGDYKVYIIDEVHMLSQGAFNALLKTLEEPPSHVVFILATTEIHKVLPTIISRCQRYDFSRIDSDLISKRLDQIVESENREIEKGASSVIASLSGGGMRNALTILEQALILNDDLITKDAI
ncbi:MAG: DNA polymerase III subunit gamma/tau, partial [Erysipelothrix sp.]|nr:DNA polymerase III subunit gamma/tau [Erysipelothrix sp.]